MQLLRQVASALLLALWLPASSFCFVERTGVLPDTECCPSSATEAPVSDHTGPAPCCLLASGIQTSCSSGRFALETLALSLFTAPLDSHILVTPGESVVRSAIDPQFTASWHIALRASLPSRAPPAAV